MRTSQRITRYLARQPSEGTMKRAEIEVTLIRYVLTDGSETYDVEVLEDGQRVTLPAHSHPAGILLVSAIVEHTLGATRMPAVTRRH